MTSELLVLATRPKAQNRAWCEQLRSAGHQVIDAPAIEIRPLSSNSIDKSCVERLAEYDVVIFVSQNAVAHGCALIEDFWPQLPGTLSFAAIGKKTGNAVSAWLDSVGASNRVIYASGAENSETLLDLAELKSSSVKKVAIFRGKGGRPLLAEQLEQRGYIVDLCETYERLAADISTSLSDFNDAHVSRAITVLSGETLVAVTKGLVTVNISAWQSIPVIVPGTRVAKIASELGYSNIVIAMNASESAILASLDKLVQRN